MFVESALNPSLTATPQVQRSMKQEQEKENVATRKEKFLKKKNVEKESEMQEQGWYILIKKKTWSAHMTNVASI